MHCWSLCTICHKEVHLIQECKQANTPTGGHTTRSLTSSSCRHSTTSEVSKKRKQDELVESESLSAASEIGLENDPMASYMERILEKYSNRMMEKLDVLNSDTVSRFKNMENGIQKSISDLSARITIAEHNPETRLNENNEKILSIENNSLATATRITSLEEEVVELKQSQNGAS